MTFNSQDKTMLNGLNKVLDEATFPLKKREITSFAMILNWLSELDKRIDEELKEKPKKKTTKKAGSK